MQIENPYAGTASLTPLRGNFHGHTVRSDGTRAPQAVIDDYAQRGYGILMISDHDVYTDEADLAKLDGRGMILVPGNEVSRNGPHMLHIGPGGFVEPLPQRQTVISDIVSRGGMCVINHPNWQDAFDHCTIAKMREWVGWEAMEIYNGVIGRLHGSPYATNKWDILLSEGRRIWGMANDDSHRAEGDVELGWNVVYPKERTAASVLEALRAGRYYCSTGVTISGIEVEGNRIRIRTENAQRIVALANIGRRVAVADAAEMELTVPEGARYIRFECWGPGEKFAWTQPFYITQSDELPPQQREYIVDWQVSALQDLPLEQARPVEAAESGLGWMSLTCDPKAAAYGFADVRKLTAGKQGVVYLATTITRDAASTERLLIGFDGPVRVWLNGELLFDGPGSNPAIRDRVQLNARLRKGDNRLVFALETNGGKAQGVFARLG